MCTPCKPRQFSLVEINARIGGIADVYATLMNLPAGTPPQLMQQRVFGLLCDASTLRVVQHGIWRTQSAASEAPAPVASTDDQPALPYSFEHVLELLPLAIRQKHREEIVALRAQVQNLRRFKTYVHSRLDQAGIDAHEAQNAVNGCRIGARLDDVLVSRPANPSERERLLAAINVAENSFGYDAYQDGLTHAHLEKLRAQLAALSEDATQGPQVAQGLLV
ncbi:hypothetical protein LJ737_04345 [Hymenobacter sp. 15J16-1T3B]|uniref:hypothetical protein n=1 Tax=Hymenobacter sp. 15J16-1T3B TaxID=2886941 RepID=UPI001D10D354|nr:hypothetical protein [Hymenobacter sp. 15J16-1T3B]MCC3156453.1 hypothetical protein [Hymenobacter sp. 15J16-1T3B]